jgi:PAS domain S-box-containing protein
MARSTQRKRIGKASELRDALATVNAVAIALHRLSDPRAVFRTALGELMGMTGAPMGIVCTFDNGKRYLKAVSWQGTLQGAAVDSPFRADEKLIRHLAKQHAFLITGTAAVDAACPPMKGCGLEALIGVPLVGLRDPVGIAFLGFQHTPELGPEDLELLSAVGVQAGIAIDRTGEITPDGEAQAAPEHLRQLLDSSLDLILTLDSRGIITYANARLEEVTGYRMDQVVGRGPIRFVPRGLRRTLWQRWRAVRAGQRQVFDAEFRKADGTYAACQVMLSPIEGADAYLLVIRDLSEEQALRSRLVQAEKSAALGRLAAGAAHELNNPLTAVLGFAQILQEEVQDELIKQDLGRIIRGALRARRIVKNLLAFARQESLVRAETDVNQTLRASLNEFTERISQAGIEVVTELDEELPYLWADGRQLKIVWDNLIKNAYQAMEAQGSGRLLVRTELIDNVVRVLISDTGPGIPMAYLGRIFDPFFTTKEVGKGVGLGLSLCKGIIEAHGGQIWVESAEGEGATFVVELPVEIPLEG